MMGLELQSPWKNKVQVPVIDGLLIAHTISLKLTSSSLILHLYNRLKPGHNKIYN